MMYLFDLALGSLYNFGPREEETWELEEAINICVQTPIEG